MESALTWLKGKSDLVIATSVVVVILIMIIPLNPFFIDLFIALSISTSLMILLLGMYTHRPLDFSVFPSILLIVTLFRLSLNIASTRLILLHGDEGTQAAGRIIKAFGTFIIGAITWSARSYSSSSSLSTSWSLRRAPGAWPRWRLVSPWTLCRASR